MAVCVGVDMVGGGGVGGRAACVWMVCVCAGVVGSVWAAGGARACGRVCVCGRARGPVCVYGWWGGRVVGACMRAGCVW